MSVNDSKPQSSKSCTQRLIWDRDSRSSTSYASVTNWTGRNEITPDEKQALSDLLTSAQKSESNRARSVKAGWKYPESKADGERDRPQKDSKSDFGLHRAGPHMPATEYGRLFGSCRSSSLPFCGPSHISEADFLQKTAASTGSMQMISRLQLISESHLRAKSGR